jgi:hypothetical protein
MNGNLCLERRAGNCTYSHPAVSHQDIIKRSKFNLEIHEIPGYNHVWTIESIIGNIYSTSYGSKRFLGESAKAFEEELRKELLKMDSSGLFMEEMNLLVKLAVKK